MLGRLAMLWSSRTGNVSVIFALASPLVIGSAAFAVETGYWYHRQHQLQGAADNAAFAAALEDRAGSNLTAIQTAALNVAVQNGYDASAGALTVQTPPTSGAYAGSPSAVTVTVTQTQPRFFTQIFFNKPVVETAKATAAYQTVSNACVLALSPSAPQAAYFSGNASIGLNGCVVMSDSVAADAVYVWGSASVSADCVVSAGGVADNGGLKDTVCPAPVTNAAPAADPFASVPAPSTSGPCLTASGGTLQPGVYCSGLDLKGDVTLSPGVYVVEGSMRVNGNANITGSGVTIYLAGGAGVTINGNATLNLSAPTSGTYSGILFFGDRSASGVSNTFDGSSSSVMTGALYFPTQSVAYKGDYAGANGCTQLVAYTVSWTGNASLNADCTNYGMSPIPALQSVKLVG
jgi:Flp pilus assembly protein TadG